MSKLKALFSQNSPRDIGNMKHCCYEPNVFSKRKRGISSFSSEYNIFLFVEEWREHTGDSPFQWARPQGVDVIILMTPGANGFQQQPEEDTASQSLSTIAQPLG